MPGPGRKLAIEARLRMPPRCRIRLSENRSDRSVRVRTLTVDHAELLGTVAVNGPAEHAEARIVDDVVDLDAFGGQDRGNLVTGIGLLEIAGNHDRRRAAAGHDFVSQFRQAIRTSRHQGHAMAVRCENARQLGAYARRGTGNQRHTLGHDSILINQLQEMRLTAGTRA